MEVELLVVASIAAEFRAPTARSPPVVTRLSTTRANVSPCKALVTTVALTAKLVPVPNALPPEDSVTL